MKQTCLWLNLVYFQFHTAFLLLLYADLNFAAHYKSACHLLAVFQTVRECALLEAADYCMKELGDKYVLLGKV